MAELILTDAEKAAALWSDLDNAALGAIARKNIHSLESASAQANKIAAIGACLLLIGEAARSGAEEYELSLDGVTLRGFESGDWAVSVRRK